MLIKFDTFAGENRAMHPTRMPAGAGMTSRNHKPGRGDLRPWKAPLQVATVPQGSKSIYRMGRDVVSDTQYWLAWPNHVSVVRGMSANDATERTYYTGDGAPKATDNTIGLAAAPYPSAYRDLGVPAPNVALTATLVTDGETYAATENRSYVFTYVTEGGEEGPPSQPVTIAVKAGATVRLTGFGGVPSGNHNITAKRVYKTFSSATTASYFFVGELGSTATDYLDNNVTQGEPLQTIDWGAPPANSKCLTPLWGGMLALVSGNTVRLSEPYAPYAWPIAYEYTFADAVPVALGTFEQTLVVLTNNKPVMLTGSAPDAMDVRNLDINQSCVSPQSVVSMGVGVVWASPDGLCFVGYSGAKMLTEQSMTREDWQAIRPDTIVASQYQGLYVATYEVAGVKAGFVVDPANPGGIYFLDQGYDGYHYDTITDSLYTLKDGVVGKWDAGATMTVVARSAKVNAGQLSNFTCAQVLADAYPVQLTIHADGATPYSVTVRNSNPVRLPANRTALYWSIEVTSTGSVQCAAIASSFAELAKV